MPGFLMFEEFGLLDPVLDAMGETGAKVAKAALRMVPMSWLAHGVIGEYNVDVDPLAMLRGDDLDLLNFGEAYKGWIAVRSIRSEIIGAASRDRDAENEGLTAVDGEVGSLGGAGNGDGPRKATTKARDRREISNRGALTATVEIDASLTKMIQAALEAGDGKPGSQGGKEYDVADLHMCTTAQVDVSQLTLGNNSPAAALIQTLVAAMLFNIVPYLTISMRKVKIEKIDLNLEADPQEPPAADVDLTFEKAIWTYHVINGSNMNLISTSAEYNFAERKTPKAGFSVGSMLNPFG